MVTMDREICNCKISDQITPAEENGVDREALCQKICANILQGLLEGYEELKEKNPEKVVDFQPKIEELTEQIKNNDIASDVKTVQ